MPKVKSDSLFRISNLNVINVLIESLRDWVILLVHQHCHDAPLG